MGEPHECRNGNEGDVVMSSTVESPTDAWPLQYEIPEEQHAELRD